ncbi:MAG: type II secretion system F family protein [Pirellulaceae bacterium]|nr:type II secretion system F family protein [Pirellulaceae bacterium]
MAQFRYQATDDNGRTQTGEIAARDQDDAHRQLTDRGLTVEHLAAVNAAQFPPAPSRLTSSDAEELVTQVAEIGKANIPMSIGLRAAASESTNRRIKQALEQLARGTDLGQPLEDVLNANSGSFPPHVAGLIAAATRTAQLGGALEELLEHQRQMRDIRGTVISAITYPLLVIGLATIVFLLLMLDIVPIFGKMFEEFELELPAATMSLIQVSDACVAMTLGEQKWLLLGVGTTTIVTLLLIRFVAGSAGWRRFLGTAPLFGPIVTWSGAAAFAQMMGVLLDYDIPLPRALELTSDAVRDGNVREACRRLVDGITDGQALANVLEDGGYLPETLVPFVRSGEQHGDLAGALKLASQVFVERIGLRASLISSISPPVIFVFVALGIAFSVIALFMPLLALIVGLS